VNIEFSYSPPTRRLAEADPPHPGSIIGQWPDGFRVAIPGGLEILEDPFSRSELIERFEQLRADYHRL
jgi:hypothetical protein